MKVAIAVLCVVIGALAWRLTIEMDASRSRGAEIQELRAKLADLAAKQDGIELQARCAAQAEKVFHSLGYKENQSGTFDSYQNHHNSKLNKCFMTIVSSDHKTAGMIVVSKLLLDAYEQREYAEMTRASGKSSRWMDCKTIPSAGAEQLPPTRCKQVIQEPRQRAG